MVNYWTTTPSLRPIAAPLVCSKVSTKAQYKIDGPRVVQMEINWATEEHNSYYKFF